MLIRNDIKCLHSLAAEKLDSIIGPNRKETVGHMSASSILAGAAIMELGAEKNSEIENQFQAR